MALYCGIDPGLKGGIVLYDDRPGMGMPFQFHKMPLRGGKFDLPTLISQLHSACVENATFVVEKPTPFQKAGATSSFNFGYGCGILEGALTALGARAIYVPPRDWTKWAHMGTPGTLTTKLRSRMAAERLWPAEDWSHDGLTDAALIAAYGRQHLTGKETPGGNPGVHNGVGGTLG